MIFNFYRIFIDFIETIRIKRLWRKNNLDNSTFLLKNCPIDKINVGKGTYGGLYVESWSADNEELEIGNYCSIAKGVKFILGGNHLLNTITTYPFKVRTFNLQKEEAFTKGRIVIKDDVWIGIDSMILSGVTVGQGAIIGARSVVSKDVPPYSIVVGNPARIIKKRFSEEVINHLLEIDFKSIKWEQIPVDKLYKPLNSVGDIDDIINNNL